MKHLGGRERHQGAQRDGQGPARVRRLVDVGLHRRPDAVALEQGYEVYVVTDACGDVSTEAHERA